MPGIGLTESSRGPWRRMTESLCNSSNTVRKQQLRGGEPLAKGHTTWRESWDLYPSSPDLELRCFFHAWGKNF